MGVACDSDQLLGKRRFCLRDEDFPEKENYLSGKKNKSGHMMITNEIQMVEVASHHWPQFNQ